jgi:hypothetical protein
MGQLESKLDQSERFHPPLPPNSDSMTRNELVVSASPYHEDAMQQSCQSPPSSPTSSRGSFSPGMSTPKTSPSRSVLSFWHTSEKRLIEAAKRGDDEEVSDLLTDGTNVNTKTTIKKETPLHKAAQYCNISTVLLLLLNGADPRSVGTVCDH